ncbi:Rapamycin-binding domain [Pseudocohnilembus persalinus]|uniref:non-specific serine/threonine protein kinase n=1 Tax=Pseudocohnilembus persalinus TaxID=266149 RepID=A0A0V0QWS9_PSEPJ|nr:Rapamycin-binding domain [Pseudocohnilembus persalinus]|eukprot:KRX06464.1 Rapamycin-binding domain [Pseudocohnilembus persalinus]
MKNEDDRDLIKKALTIYRNLDETGKEKDELTEFIKLSKKTQDEAYTIDQQQGQNKESHMFKKNIDAISLIKEFDTQQKTLKEDWKEWMRKSSVELLRQSSNLVLAPCYSIAEVYPELSTELYNIAFACVWGILNDQQKEFIIQQLHKVINPQTNENIPIEILQTILNLAEFMQHDKEGLQIDNSTLGDLAERCEAYAKALYYREHEFETASEKTIESLISLYTNLGQKEAASGLLTYAKKNLKIDLKMSWYERLQNWEKALDDYRIEQLKDPQNDNFIPRMRCLNALSNWENLLNQCEPYILNNAQIPEEKLGQQKEIVHLAANAAMNLGSWDKLEKCVKQLPNENTDKEFWQAAVCINQKKYFEAREYIKRSITKLDSKVSGLLLESYNRAYDNLLRLQQLFEMEEIIDLLLFKEKVKYIIQDQRGESKTNMIEEYDRRKSNLQDIWNDRLNGNPRDTDTWQKVLSVRGLLFSKAESMETWLKFARMALKQDQNQISQKIIDKLKEEINPRAINEFDYPPKLVVSNFQVQLKNGIIKEKQFNEQLTLFLLDKSKNIDNSLKAKIFLKMGKQMYQKQDELNPEYIYQVNKLYKKSFEFDEGFHKTWHQSALLNYDAVKFYENNPNTIKQVEFENFIYSSLKGFIKSIALGNQSEKRSKYMLQDSLRLLQIIFQYSHLENVAKEFNDNFETIDIRTWIEVVPQIIARIANQKLLHKLLLHISKHSPQALIYPLTVACKDKQTGRAVSAQQILDDMKTHSPNLVQQALLIAEELNRTAILMKEKWYEGIENAWKDHHSAENNSKAFINQLMELHGLMKLKPESQSEIAFHQNHGTDLAEAEAWLQKYQQTENEICLCQAFDIYYNTYTKISTKLENLTCVHLENVSPKLLATKNCEISIPGLYKPNKPIVKIACFQPKLPVLSSKQHPRRLFIYGTDNKQYGFLLKGREDLRQDERVMQLFALVNRLLHNNPKTEKKDLLITRYSVTPLSTQTGLLGWVSDCDTLQCLIREYRKTYNIRGTTENDLKSIFCNNYDLLPLPNKVEIFRHILENTKGEDLQKVLWLKSNTSETWLERRTNYTRSLATMSIVGYILGLGDRHPSNIMLQRYTGKIVHIDFGDCFEVAMKRDKFPEKVPFRLTRMLVNAMEACGIEGNYRSICEAVMQVCTDNKESLLAVLEAFVYDPIITWKLLTMEDAESKIGGQEQNQQSQQATQQQMLQSQQSQSSQHQDQKSGYVGSMMKQTTMQHLVRQDRKKTKNLITHQPYSPKYKEGRERELQKILQKDQKFHTEIKNKKALEVLERIKKKLVRKDFNEKEQLSVEEQVKKLINQATSHENICQAYIGWCPFW